MKAASIIPVLIVVCACTQTGKKIDYFGQTPAGSTATLFAPGTVSTEANEHSALAFAPDGSVVVWAVMNPQYRGRLFEMSFSNGQWSRPVTPSFADTIADYYAPGFAPDGKTLLFSSRRKAPGYREGRGNRIWSVERTAAGWGTPVPFDTIVSKGEEFSHSITESGTLYFSSASGSVGTSLNIQMSTNNGGKYSEPLFLPYNINTPGYEDGPYVSPDEDYLIFESTRPEGIQGSHDLYISFRTNDREWGMPVNMGPSVNSAAMERFPRVTPDGKYLLFASNRDQSSSRAGFDFYWIDAKVIDELKQQNSTIIAIQHSPDDDILAAIHSGDAARVEQSLKQWLQTHPGNLDALVLYSAVLRKQKRFSDAEQLLATMTPASNNESVIIESALVKFGLNKENEAVQLLAPVFSGAADLRHRYLELTNALYEMGKFDASDEYFGKAMAIDGNGVQYYNRACGYAHLGETVRVFDNLNKAADLGYNSREQYENDQDLAAIKSDKRFRTLMGKLK
ncbi:MAG TPA: tetratricopeptide repeat protein [Cyclobacteriaceae bacterium]|nr:tetratricopeptide repeat protein [Cyclobacteriaceae bacterium]